MTSQENQEETREFFEAHGFFGLNGRRSIFQPGHVADPDSRGRLILKDEVNLLANPDGHGGSLKALYDSGMAAR